MTRKPNGYWKNWNNVKVELERIIESTGHFPTQSEIYCLNKSLPTRISEYHGGLYKVRERLGYQPKEEKPRGFWKDFNNIKKELEQIIQEIGHFPSQKEVVDLGRRGMVGAIVTHFCGLDKLRSKLGYRNRHEKPKGFWKDWNNAKNELEKIITDIGHFPTAGEFRENYSLLLALGKYHGGLRRIRELFGYEPLTKPSGFWKEIRNVKEDPLRAYMAMQESDKIISGNISSLGESFNTLSEKYNF